MKIKKRHTFIFGAFILAVGGIIAKIIGAFYKVPLTHILGSNGIGVYYLIFPLYSLLLVLGSSGIAIAVTKLVAQERARKNKENEMKIFTAGLILSFTMSLVFSVIIILYSEQFSLLQGNINATIGYIAIAPALVCASVISIVRAYFQGIENMLPSSVSAIFEQAIKLMIGLLLSYKLLYLGVEYAVLGAVLGVTISEFFAMILIIVNFMVYKRKYDYKFFEVEGKLVKRHVYVFYKKVLKNKRKFIHSTKKIKRNRFNLCFDKEYMSHKTAFAKVIKYAFPATLSSLVIPITGFVDSFLIINLLINVGFSSIVATSLYGLSNGMVASLISLPVLLIVSISTAIVPNLSQFDEKSINTVQTKCGFFIKLTWLLALPMFVFFVMYSPEIIKVLFGGGLTDKGFMEYDFAYKLLMFGSVSIIYYAFLQTFTAILQAINKPTIPFIALFISLLFRILFTYVFVSIPEINVFGVMLSNIVFLSLASFICLIYIRKHIALSINMRRFVMRPIFALGVASISAYFMKLFFMNFLPTIIYSIVSGIIGIAIYLVLIYITKVFTYAEQEMFAFRLRSKKLKLQRK